MKWPTFSKDPDTPNLLYMSTDAYGDFTSVITYDTATSTVTHITSPELEFNALRPISWNVYSVKLSREVVYFMANVQGWEILYTMPLIGPHAHTVFEVDLEWEGGDMAFQPNFENGKPFELVSQLKSHRSSGHIAYVDLTPIFDNLEVSPDTKGEFLKIKAPVTTYSQASAAPPSYPTRSPQVIKWKSFDGLEISAMYYRPIGAEGPVPLVINIHGGPASQAHSAYRMPVSRLL